MTGSSFNNNSTRNDSPLLFLSTLGDLQYFSCDGCAVNGPLPIYLPHNLSQLELKRAGLTGGLLEQWSSSTSLTNINLFYNKLTGPIPNSWSSLTKLQYLDFSYNELNGIPPDWIHTNKVQLFYGISNYWNATPSWCREEIVFEPKDDNAPVLLCSRPFHDCRDGDKNCFQKIGYFPSKFFC
eukprot:TRINITY_DN3132_c0_g1_i1.p2 TRINITY_DN3132_c0_g1~~TRINITY_DN3132_c0_g1_i1.p2  ORF type:complete len:182 (+),score=3.71 TRINITY_DN3132_c0_g1_i1:781-1326(+)